ncbi:SAM-dependent methyltransferase [Photobacterium galatheae]|uniref:Methyltransferase domain-containing protein n=1 Tax=Photobacterium galatheae TaxID=1654360 RepID=A0A066RQ04_9GAMM|nr:class I SAM-dependent methyltransferase [Photobacterium galatheae]KDM91156.1 hypothetical protein EA58_13480 [Photobacterium galatheae]MCM0150122.1 class I SAM-dependent methyltransferase [Photobacterium galatheae]
MLLNCPLGEERVERLISILALTPDSKVVDIGCGEGELLLRLAKATGAKCLGLDISEACISTAMLKAEQQGLSDLVRFEVADGSKLQLTAEYDVAICMGSVHAFATGEAAYPAALSTMQQWLTPRGQLLIGEAYWKQSPDQAYLDFMGEPVGIYQSHQGNIEVAESHGLIVAYAATSHQDEWDHFEGSFRLNAERAAQANPEDEAALQKRDAVREWNTYYHRYGRDTMGFGFYLMLKVENGDR